MTTVTENLSSKLGGTRPYARVTALVFLSITIGYLLATHGSSQTLFFVLALSVTIAYIAARYPWLAVVSPLLVFIVFGVGIASGVSAAGAQVNFADLLLLPALAPTVVRVLAGRRELPYPSIPAIMIAVWILLATGVGLLLGNPFSIVRNELHILLFIILAYYWAVIEIRSSRYLKLAVIAILGATAVAGMKALYISFFVIHTQEGTSDIWQAVTAMSEQLGGQRTILNGADTMFVLAIPIIAALALFYKQRRVYMYLLAAFLFTLFGLLISLTRTNWATVLLVVLLVMALGAWSSGKQAVRIASLIILLSMTSIFLSQYFTPGTSTYDLGELLQRRLEPNPYTGAGNLNYRIRESEALIEQAQRHAILGNGLGARFAFVEFHGSPTVSWAHNGHLWVYLKSGYLGLFLFYGAIITACWQLFSISTRRINSLINSTALGFGAALLALMIMSLLVNRISSMEGAYFIGLAFALPQIYKQIEVENDT